VEAAAPADRGACVARPWRPLASHDVDDVTECTDAAACGSPQMAGRGRGRRPACSSRRGCPSGARRPAARPRPARPARSRGAAPRTRAAGRRGGTARRAGARRPAGCPRARSPGPLPCCAAPGRRSRCRPAWPFFTCGGMAGERQPRAR